MRLFIDSRGVIEKNTNESLRSDPTPKEVQNIGVKKIIKSTHKVFQQEEESSGSEHEATEKEKLQLISSNSTALGVFGGG